MTKRCSSSTWAYPSTNDGSGFERDALSTARCFKFGYATPRAFGHRAMLGCKTERVFVFIPVSAQTVKACASGSKRGSTRIQKRASQLGAEALTVAVRQCTALADLRPKSGTQFAV